jgi:hypothetical protein
MFNQWLPEAFGRIQPDNEGEYERLRPVHLEGLARLRYYIKTETTIKINHSLSHIGILITRKEQINATH